MHSSDVKVMMDVESSVHKLEVIWMACFSELCKKFIMRAESKSTSHVFHVHEGKEEGLISVMLAWSA